MPVGRGELFQDPAPEGQERHVRLRGEHDLWLRLLRRLVRRQAEVAPQDQGL
jgi:hypothetical protein